MAAPNRVDELRKRYHEQPRRFFAPLANEYRKTGFLDRAILLCEKHLAEQPDNLNGLVVYGQSLFESGRHADAKVPFEMSLKLDQENLIALRHLGDIAKLEGDLEGARTWYARVLEFDRRNDEVLALLEEVGGPPAKEPTSGPSAQPSIVSVNSSVRVTSGTSVGDSLGLVNLDGPAPEPPSGPVKTRPIAAVRKPTPKTVEVTPAGKPAKRSSLMDIAFDFGELPPADGPSAPPPPPPPRALEEMDTLVVEPPSVSRVPAMPSIIDLPPEPTSLDAPPPMEGLELAEYSAEVSPLAGLESTDFETGDVAPLSDLESTDFQADDVAPMSGLEPMDFDAAGVEPDAVPGLESQDFEPPSAEETRRQSLAGLPLIDDLPPAPEPLADLPQLDTSPRPRTPARTPIVDPNATLALGAPGVRAKMETAATFVTETMAELYIKQGFRDRAIDVYRQLITQAPGDATLRKKLAALEAEAAVPALDFETPSGEHEEVPPAPANSMLSEVSFDNLELVTPPPAPPSAPARPSAPVRAAVPTPAPKRPAPPPEPAGPTAREVLAAFARRGFTPLSSPVIAAPKAAPSAVPAPSGGPVNPKASPLDALFGESIDRDDERAANQLAGIGAMSGPSGGSRLDSLFGEGPSAPMPTTEAGRAPMARASDRLRFDQFFTPSDGAAVDAAAVRAAETEARESVELPSVDLPLDDDPSVELPSAELASAEPPSATPPDDDDLDQFHGWLKGLAQ